MAQDRALLTEAERNILKRPLEDADRADLLPSLTTRISEELPQDLKVLKRHEPVLYDSLIAEVETSVVEHPWDYSEDVD